MTWQNADNWAGSLTVGGFTDWRLPTTLQPDATCGGQGAIGSFGVGCSGSEMGHLYNVEGITFTTPGPFLNLQGLQYWSSTETGVDELGVWFHGEDIGPSAIGAWHFTFAGGVQSSNGKDADPFHAWAVRSGDVGQSPIPEPSTMLLFGTGLAALATWRYRKGVNA